MNWLKEALAKAVATHVFLQILAVLPTAYITGWIGTFWQKGEWMLDIFPPLFVPILMVLLCPITIYHGFISPFLVSRREKNKKASEAAQKEIEAYRQEVESAYQWVAQSHNPAILDPAQPGNPEAIKEYAQRAVDTLRPKLLKKYGEGEVPSKIRVESDMSLVHWYEYLREERARVSQ